MFRCFALIEPHAARIGARCLSPRSEFQFFAAPYAPLPGRASARLFRIHPTRMTRTAAA